MRLTTLLYNEHYKEREGILDTTELAKKKEIEGMYQARVELNWLIDWANGLDPPSDDRFLRAVQGAVLDRIDVHKPLSLILGSQPFAGCDIKCTAPLLSPRPETEEWFVWWATRHGAPARDEPLRILDLCCGTGCVGAAALRMFPNVEVVGVDVEPLALRTALDNYETASRDSTRAVAKAELAAALARLDAEAVLDKTPAEALEKLKQAVREEHAKRCECREAAWAAQGLVPGHSSSAAAGAAASENGSAATAAPDDDEQPRRYTLIESDMFRHLPEQLRGSFDVILCNPPYILPEEYETQLPASVKRWESRLALVGDARHEGQPLLYFKELRDEAPAWLSAKPPVKYTGPRMLVEVGLQARVMTKFFAENRAWGRSYMHLDCFEQPRFLEVFCD